LASPSWMLIDIAELSGQEASPSWMLIDIAELSGQEASPSWMLIDDVPQSNVFVVHATSSNRVPASAPLLGS
ncbi:MAG: hypothetical protein NTV04_14600, partial [Deltaproteobacteria bacterium]|nr:hypothetical protein [Deltaproteobacteria bacterium]